MQNAIALVMGTRPEVLKFAPLYHELSARKRFSPLVIASGQHESMANQAFEAFQMPPDENLALMTKGQTPNSFLSELFARLPSVLERLKPALVVVQGDTTTAFGAAVCAFHLGIPVAHLEAGLRTGDFQSPFPEEMNRVQIGRIASLHFAPTERAQTALLNERVPGEIHVVGNTAVDAVLEMSRRLVTQEVSVNSFVSDELFSRATRTILVTGHRRENFEAPLQNLCTVLLRLRDTVSDVQIVYPVHLNPNVYDTVHTRLANQERITLCPPLDYPSMVYAMKRSTLIISDSGGIQEEAPSLGKRVFVTRNCTERQEAIEAGTAVLCPLESPDTLYEAVVAELQETTPLSLQNPFGNGTTAKVVADILEQYLA